jgi:hypothetical protein
MLVKVMYDAVPSKVPNIPINAAMVAGFIDSPHYTWSAANWARFPNAVHVTISTSGTDAGVVCDVENGDLTPAQAVTWVRTRRASGVDPTVYCNASTWLSVINAFKAAGVAQPHYWIAQYDGVAALPTLGGIQAVAKQFTDNAPGNPYDTSCVADYWPGVDPAPNQPVVAAVTGEDDAVAAGCFGPTSALLNKQGYVVLAVPQVGTYCKAARLTLASGWGDSGTITVDAIEGPQKYVGHWSFGVGKDNPWVQALPTGTMQISIQYQSDRPLGWCLDVDK